jgi:putative ABC transport system substrate-binding protein
VTVNFGRRKFIAVLASATAWPLAARAQQRPTPLIGALGSATADSLAPRLTALKLGLKETGFVEGQNVLIESLWANDQSADQNKGRFS